MVKEERAAPEALAGTAEQAVLTAVQMIRRTVDAAAGAEQAEKAVTAVTAAAEQEARVMEYIQ